MYISGTWKVPVAFHVLVQMLQEVMKNFSWWNRHFYNPGEIKINGGTRYYFPPSVEICIQLSLCLERKLNLRNYKRF